MVYDVFGQDRVRKIRVPKDKTFRDNGTGQNVTFVFWRPTKPEREIAMKEGQRLVELYVTGDNDGNPSVGFPPAGGILLTFFEDEYLINPDRNILLTEEMLRASALIESMQPRWSAEKFEERKSKRYSAIEILAMSATWEPDDWAAVEKWILTEPTFLAEKPEKNSKRATTKTVSESPAETTDSTPK